MLLDRVNLLLNVLISKSDVNAGDQIKRLISYIDRLLYSYAENQIDLEIINEMQGSSDDRGLKNTNEGNYLLESIFKEEFLNSIQTNVEMLDYLKANDISCKKLKSDLKEVERLYKDSEIDKKKSFESENIYILNDLYQLGIKDQIEREAYIQRYKEELERQQEEIDNWEKGLKSFKKEKKYFLNSYSIPEILKTKFYNNYKKDIVKKMITVDLLKNYLEIETNYEKERFKSLYKMIDSKWMEIMVNYSNIYFIEGLFGQYHFKLRKEIINNYNPIIYKMEDKIFRIFYDSNFIKFTQENLSEEGIERINKYIIDELDKEIIPCIDSLQDVYNEKVIAQLKEMYKEQDKRDEKFNYTKDKLVQLEDTIKELEDMEQNKNKKKRTEIKNELLKVNSLKSATSVVIGKMFITALYKDKDFMNKEELDLKEFLKELDENNIICD